MKFLERSIEIIKQAFPSAHFILEPKSIQEPGLFVHLSHVKKVDVQSVILYGALYVAFLERDMGGIAKALDPLIDFMSFSHAYLDGKMEFLEFQSVAFSEFLSIFAIHFSIRLYKEYHIEKH